MQQLRYKRIMMRTMPIPKLMLMAMTTMIVKRRVMRITVMIRTMMMNFTRVLCLMMTMMIRLVMQNRVHVLSAKGAGASREQNSGCPEKPNTKGMSKKGADEALHKWQKS